MGGGLEVNKNRWIEEWNAGRENLALNFRFTRRSLAVIGLAVPILVYKGIVREFHIQEVLIHRMAGDYIGDDRVMKGFMNKGSGMRPRKLQTNMRLKEDLGNDSGVYKLSSPESCGPS